MSDSQRADSFMHRLSLAERKLAEFDVVWDGEKYAFTPAAHKATTKPKTRTVPIKVNNCGMCRRPGCPGGCYEY